MAEKNEDILARGRRRFNAAIRHDKEERRLAREDVRFAVNDENCQWDEKIRAMRDAAKPPRPYLVMNKIPEKIDQADGEFRQLKPSIKVKAVDSASDPKIADIFGGLIRHIEYNSMARAAYNSSHSSVLYSGRGAWEIDIEDSEDDPFEQDIVIKSIPNALSVVWDHVGAKRIDKSDGSFVFVHQDIPTEEFKKQYPDATVEDWPSDESYTGWQTEDTVRVVKYWWKEKGTKKAYRVNRGGMEMTVWELEDGEQVLKDAQGKELVKDVNHPKIMRCIMTANNILEGPDDSWPSKYFGVIIEIGKEVNIDGKSKTRGMTRFAKEPQQMYNYWSTAEAEFGALAPKMPYMVTPKMIGTHKTQWDNAPLENRFYLFFEGDPLVPGGPERQSPPQLSSAMVAAKQSMEHDIMSAMGIYEAGLGSRGPQESGKAIMAKKRQGDVGSYAFTDHFEFALTHSGKVLIDLIPHVYKSERIVRIRGESGTDEMMIPINARPGSPLLEQVQDLDEDHLVQNDYSKYINDLGVGKYDLVATIGPSFATQREEALEFMVSLVEKMPKLADAAPDLIIGLLDMPMSEELMRRVKLLVPPELRKLEPGEEPPEEEPPTAEQMIKMKEAEIKWMEQLRKNFDSQVNSLLTVAKAEAEEMGPQYDQYKAWTEDIWAEIMKLAQPGQSAGQPAGQPQGV